MKKLLVVSFLLFTFSSCTKQPASTNPNPAASTNLGADMIGSATPNPDLLLLEATINVPQKFSKKVGKSDTMFWALTSEEGKRIAHGRMKVEKLPRTISIQAKNLLQPLKKDAGLLLSVHLAKPGNEFKPIEKGWLFASSSTIKFESATKPSKKISVGDHINLNLEMMSF